MPSTADFSLALQTCKNRHVRQLGIAQFCGESRVSRSDGERLREAIEESWKAGETIELDFANVRIASVSFFDEAIGLLARDHSLEVLMNEIKVQNMNPGDRKLLNRIVLSRKRARRGSK